VFALLLLVIPALAVPSQARASTGPVTLLTFPANYIALALRNPARPSDCAPPQPVAAGVTVLAVHIASNGRVSRSQIIASSGSTELDRAAASCVSAMYVPPRTNHGVPVGVDWQMEVVWPDGRVRTAHADEEDISCSRFYPTSAIRLAAEGDTLLSFVIAADGRVKDVSVIEPSGHTDLDAAAIQCVSLFRYHPATTQGKPIEIDGNIAVPWRLR
jgi:TonB family protein